MRLGKIYAGLGMKEEASANGKKGVDIITQSVDALQLPAFKEILAEIFAQLNRPAEAVDVLRELSAIPNYTSVHRWKIEPWYDPIRDSEEFRQLIREFEEK